MITQYPNWLQAAERLYWVHLPCQYGWPVTRKKNREMLQDLETPEANNILLRREPQCSTIQELNDKHDALHAAVFAATELKRVAKSDAIFAARNYKMNWQSHGS
jgi:hypothetical protein